MTSNKRIRGRAIIDRASRSSPTNQYWSRVPSKNLFQQPALMFAYKGSGATICVRWDGRCRLWGAYGRRQDPKTRVELALMRGLVTA